MAEKKTDYLAVIDATLRIAPAHVHCPSLTDATHHHLVIAPTRRGMTEGIIVPDLLTFPKRQRPAKGWRRHVRRLKAHNRHS
jgi:hypothetical protein